MTGEFMFGDAEPEDAWDPDDPPREQVRNIIRRLALLRVIRDARNEIRLNQIREDLEHIFGRL